MQFYIIEYIFGLLQFTENNGYYYNFNFLPKKNVPSSFKLLINSLLLFARNYHVFYYLLVGASDEERKRHFLLEPKDYHYLNQVFNSAKKIHEILAVRFPVSERILRLRRGNEREEWVRAAEALDGVGGLQRRLAGENLWHDLGGASARQHKVYQGV